MVFKNQTKIAIVTHKMVMGGIEKSLIELCKKLLDNGCEVTLYLEELGGELYSEIPKCIKIYHIFEKCNSSREILTKKMREGNFSAIFGYLFANLYNRCGWDPVKGWKYTVKYVDEGDEKYEYAFAYGAPVSFSVIYVDKIINAKKKYAWIHNEIDQLSLNIVKYKEIFRNFDKIICVSKKVQDLFIKYFPEYKTKTFLFYNFIDRKYILSQAEKNIFNDRFNGIKLLTVGRICYQKGQDLIPVITKRLVENGYNIRWYCVGDGEKKEDLIKLIKKEKMEDRVILLGSQKNPYPFFSMADIYIQPSRSEGFGITISEAKIFNLPIITTDFAAANEQICNGETGLIVQFDENAIYNAIVKLLDKHIREEIQANFRIDPKKCESNLDELLN